MAGERFNSGITAGLIACLSVGILLLGIELSLSMRGGDRLSPVNAAVLAGAALLMYAALAWRGSQTRGAGLFVRWWGSMVLGHALLGVTVGLANATLISTPADALEITRWAGAASLPMVVLQAGYSIGVSSLAWADNGRVPIGVDTAGDIEPRPAVVTAPPPPCGQPEKAAARAPHLEVYANAIERLRADDHETLIRFAAQAARCEGGLLATRDGLVIAAVEVRSLDPARVAAVLPDLVRGLEQLAAPATETPAMLHAALGGYELLAVPGETLTACLIGPEPGARETAEVILPVVAARAEALRVRHRSINVHPRPADNHAPHDRESPS